MFQTKVVEKNQNAFSVQ